MIRHGRVPVNAGRPIAPLVRGQDALSAPRRSSLARRRSSTLIRIMPPISDQHRASSAHARSLWPCSYLICRKPHYRQMPRRRLRQPLNGSLHRLPLHRSMRLGQLRTIRAASAVCRLKWSAIAPNAGASTPPAAIARSSVAPEAVPIRLVRAGIPGDRDRRGARCLDQDEDEAKDERGHDHGEGGVGADADDHAGEEPGRGAAHAH